MKFYFIVNPGSGQGRGKKIWDQLAARMKQSGINYRLILLRHPGEAHAAAAGLSSLCHPFTAVIVGGDGSINEFVNGLTCFSYITLGCIPTGSGNDFVRGLGLHTDPLAALEAILAPSQVLGLKVGTVRKKDDSHAFLVSSGIGFDADVCNGAHESGVKRFLNFFHIGKLVYLTTALGLLCSMKQYRMQITLDDGETLCFEHAFFAAVMNLPCEGGGFWFAPDADPQSPYFQICIAEGLTRGRVLQLLPLALRGRHAGRKGIHIFRCRKAEIRCAAALCVHTDGEIFGFYDHVCFEALPERLRVITR